MEIEIMYDRRKDVENILKASSAKNSSKRTSLQNLYVEQFGEQFTEAKVEAFLDHYFAANDVQIENEVARIRNEWHGISKEAIHRLSNLFGMSLEKKLTAYLTTDSRCTYNTEKGYFFVSFTSKSSSPNLIILHELLHFYTHEKYQADLTELGVTEEKYNDIKESLTVLLNSEFGDLLGGHIDRGYPQHQILRQWIAEEYAATHNLDTVIKNWVT